MKTHRRLSSFKLANSLLEAKDRRRLVASVGLIVIGSLLEVVSLGIVIPVVRAVTDGDQRRGSLWLPDFIKLLPFDTYVTLLMICLVLAFLAKNAYLVLSGYYQQRAQLSINNRLVQRMFERYIQQPYEFHLMHSSAVLLRNVQEYSSAATTQTIGPGLSLAAELLTGLGFFAVVLWVNPVATVTLVSIFALVTYVVLSSTRERTKRWGAERLVQRGLQSETLLAGFWGIKEIKMFGRERLVVETHQASLYAATRYGIQFGLLQSVPRATFEVMAVGAAAVLVIAETATGGDVGSATLTIALFGVVTFRMLPAVNRILSSFQQFSFGRAGLEGAVESFSLPVARAEARGSAHPIRFRHLYVADLTYKYPRTEKVVLNIESLSIAAGESVGVVGASGSGKSTLVDLLIGILAPTSGNIEVNGRSIADAARSWMDCIGYVPQFVYLMDTTIRRNVAFGLPTDEIDDTKVEAALRAASLWDFINEHPNATETIVGERGVRLSGGQRQRLGIARALYAEPQVLIFDEATSALDDATEREIVESIQKLAHNRTVVVVAHRTTTLRFCSRILRLENGRIVADGNHDTILSNLKGLGFRGQ
jgi:ABC-type multidrug transport system fused ATPase/permease subunit